MILKICSVIFLLTMAVAGFKWAIDIARTYDESETLFHTADCVFVAFLLTALACLCVATAIGYVLWC